MNWNAVSAIGTTLAAAVGIVGIWLNLRDKSKRLNISFQTVPDLKLYLANNSLRTVVITKMICSVKTHIFYVKYFQGSKELIILPAMTQSVDIIKQEIHDEYCKTGMCSICNANDEVCIILYDNYGRKYTVKTGFNIRIFNT